MCLWYRLRCPWSTTSLHGVFKQLKLCCYVRFHRGNLFSAKSSLGPLKSLCFSDVGIRDKICNVIRWDTNRAIDPALITRVIGVDALPVRIINYVCLTVERDSIVQLYDRPCNCDFIYPSSAVIRVSSESIFVSASFKAAVSRGTSLLWSMP